MIVAGIGCKRGASAADLHRVIDAALARAGLGREAIALIAAPAAKCAEPGVAAVAHTLCLLVVPVTQSDLEAAGRRAVTRSDRVAAMWNVPSVAEAAALAAGGPTARLLTPRVAVGPATCALAERAELATP